MISLYGDLCLRLQQKTNKNIIIRFSCQCSETFPPTTAVAPASGSLRAPPPGAVLRRWCQLWAEPVGRLNRGRRGTIPSVTQRANRSRTSPIIAPSSDAARSSNWPNVGVDGVKMAAALLPPMTAACQLHVRLSERGREAESGREREGLRRISPLVFRFTLQLSFCITCRLAGCSLMPDVSISIHAR